jgi:hypothetical protein
MRKYAADNLMFLREQYPEIYNLVKNRTSNKNEFYGEVSKNGQSNLVVRVEDRTSLHLYSKYDPGLEVARWVESLDDSVRRANDILMVGFGLGYHAAACIEAYPDKRFYIYEPNLEVLLTAIEATDLRVILDKKQIAMFAVGDDDPIIMDMLVGMYNSLKSEFAYVVLPPYRKIMPALENRMMKLITMVARNFRANISTVSHFKSEWIENIIVNTDRNLRTPSYTALKGVCQGIPAVIVGSGPSLGIEVETLRKVKDHAFIIAAGTSIMGLLHHGIEPHLVISMDPGEYNRRAFAKLDISHIPFLYISTIKHTAILDDGSSLLMHGFFNIDVISQYLMELTEDDGVLASSATVSGTAIQMASYLGCSEVVLIGQDFSYPGNRVYTEGINHASTEWAQRRLSSADLLIPNVNGSENVTNLNMTNLKSDLEAVIENYPDMSFYNASPVGAVIQHTQLKSLQQLLDQRLQNIINEDWFKDQMKQHLKLYPIERQQKTKQRTRKMLKELESFGDKINKLTIHMSATPNDKAKWFVQFEELWSFIVSHEIYEKWFSFFLVTEKIYAERYWSEMYEETDLDLKRHKLDKCAQPLLKGMEKLVPQLITHMTDLSAKLKERG